MIAMTLIALAFPKLSRLHADETSAVSGTVPAVVEKASKPISESEAIQVAHLLSEAIQKGDIEACDKLLDWGPTIDKVTELPIAPNLDEGRKNFRKRCLTTLRREASIARLLAEQVKAGGSYKFIRMNLNEPEPYVLFRLNSALNGPNYHYLYLQRRPDGAVVVADAFVFVSNERLSEGWRREWLTATKDLMRTSLDRFLFPKDARSGGADEFSKLYALSQGRKGNETLAFYRKLPDVLRKDKQVLTIRLKAAMAVSPEELTQSIKDFRKYYPDDVGVDFLLIPGHASQSKFDKALECLDRVNEQIGGDFLLLTQRASLLVAMKRIPEAKKAVTDAISGEPDLRDAYVVGLSVSLAEQNFDDTVRYLNILQNQFGYRWDDFDDASDYSEFVKSPQYLKWMDTRRKN
jgi:hypothetical protein